MLRPVVLLAALVALPFVPSAARGQAAAPPAPAPRVYLRTPTDGSVLRGGKVTVVFGLQNYGVAPAGMDFPNTGHFHLLIDAEAPEPGVLIPTDAQHLHFGKGQIETSVELPPGRHVLRVVLGDHQHRVISKELVSAPVRVTVRR